MLAEYIQYLVYIPAFFATGIKLSIRISACTSFTETIIGFRIYSMLPADLSQVFFSVAYILSTLYDDWTESQFYQSQRSKQSAGTGTHDNNLWFVFYVLIDSRLVFIVFGHFVQIYPYIQIDEDGSLPGINAALQDTCRINIPHIQSFFLYEVLF